MAIGCGRQSGFAILFLAIAAAIASRHRSIPLTTMAPATGVRVLIVDDTAIIRLLLRQCLTTSGRYDVVGEAVDGRDGIEQATRQQPDIILLDLSMPVMDGLEALPHMARCSPRSLIIVLSGFNADAVADEAIALGAHGYIEKKYRPDELLRRIADVWESASLRGRASLNTCASGTQAPGATMAEPTSVEAAAQAADQFRLAFNHAPIGTALLTVEGRFAQVNPAFCRFTGRPEVDLLGCRMDEITHTDDKEIDAPLLARLLAGDIACYQSEKRILRPDGSLVWILLSRWLFAPSHGRPRLSVAQIVDISSQKSLAEELGRGEPAF